jgi:hypothetical protein
MIAELEKRGLVIYEDTAHCREQAAVHKISGIS